MKAKEKVTGVILAGGMARRMGHQDKGLVLFKGQPLVSYAIAAMQPLVDGLFINANRNIARYQQLGFPVITDQTDTFDGPLAGLLAAMRHSPTDVLLVMPCDSPFMQTAQLQRLLDSRSLQDAAVAVAVEAGRWHPVFLAIKTSLCEDLQAYLADGGRKMETWLARHNPVLVEFGDQPELFFNINTLPELIALEKQA
jgi:molybdopterin-guanine dinucleotide biosynthesis protein A